MTEIKKQAVEYTPPVGGEQSPIEFYYNPETDQQMVRVLDIVLDVLPMPTDEEGNADPIASRFIPKWELLCDEVCWDEPTVLLVRDLALRMKGGIPTRLEGPTGVSKSFGVEILAALTNRPFLRHNFSRDSTPGEIIGQFLPKDEKLRFSFKEMKADKNLKDETIAIISEAENQSRALTKWETLRIMQIEGLVDPGQDVEFEWHYGTLAGTMMYQGGGIFLADEPNLAPGNVTECMNSAIERHPVLRIVGHEGEIIRELTEAEQQIINDDEVIPGVIELGVNFWFVAAQNPVGYGGGRSEDTEAARNRPQDRIVDPIGKEEFKTHLRFKIFGEQPDILYQNRTFKEFREMRSEFHSPEDDEERKHIETHLKEPDMLDELKDIPNIDLVIEWLTQFQEDLIELGPGIGKKGAIGTEKGIHGGSYVYTRRNLDRVLDMIAAGQRIMIDLEELFRTGELRYNHSWKDIVWEALWQEYLLGMYEEDREAVMKVIEASGILDYLGPSINNPQLPDWVKNAKDKGLDISVGQGFYTLSKADITAAGIVIDGFQKAVKKDGYEITIDSDETLEFSKVLRGTMELWEELIESERPAQIREREGERLSANEAG